MSVHWGGSHRRKPFDWSPLRGALERFRKDAEPGSEGDAAAPGEPASPVAAAVPPWGPGSA